MSRVAYVNGTYAPLAEAGVHIEDRGYQFADGVYEVCLVIDGAYWDQEGHLARLDRSLEALSIERPMSRHALKLVMASVIRKNRLRNALVYIQVTRGVAARNHPFPETPVSPALVVTAKRFDPEKNARQAERGVAVVTAPDNRWGRVDIKSIGLLPNVLAKEQARREGAAEAWLVRAGKVTEGCSSNAWIVTGDDTLVTHPLSPEILGGITRETVIDCAEAMQMTIEERPFTVEEAMAAKEAFITSATNLVMPVVRINGDAVGEGAPGEVARRLRAAYIDRCRIN